MPEHRIRLRGGWELLEAESSQTVPAVVNLPFRFIATGSRKLRLSRKFGRPRLDLRRESLWLSLGSVPGLGSASLNGNALAIEGPAEQGLEIPVEISERNELVLEVVFPADQGEAGPWGEIALVIRPFPIP